MITFSKIKHWLRFHLALPKPYPEKYDDKITIGVIVCLSDGEEFEVMRSGPISRGPMRQYPPCISFLCRKPMHGYEDKHFEYFWFRKDALTFIR